MKYHTLNDLNTGYWFSHSSGGWTPNIKVSSGLVSGENPRSDLCTPAFLLCPHTALPLCTCTSVSLSRGAPVSLPLLRSAFWPDYSPTLRTSCNLTSLSPSTITLRIRAPHMNFVGTDFNDLSSIHPPNSNPSYIWIHASDHNYPNVWTHFRISSKSEVSSKYYLNYSWNFWYGSSLNIIPL